MLHQQLDPAGANNKATVLVVDNNAENLGEIKALLEEMGNTVHTASDTSSALKIYRENTEKIDIVIIDLLMPGKDGKYLYDKIMGINPKASMIIMSGFSRNYVRDYMTNNKWWFAQKPINPEILATTIERILK